MDVLKYHQSNDTKSINYLFVNFPYDLRHIYIFYGLLFFINEKTNQFLFQKYQTKNKCFQTRFICWFHSLIFQLSFLSYQIKIKRIRLQKNFLVLKNNFIAQFIRIIKTKGILIQYRVFPLSLISTPMYGSNYFEANNHFQKYLNIIPYFNNKITNLALSFVINITAKLVFYPLEKLRTKKYNLISQTIKNIFQSNI
ncbi:unnamed protein product [Paramecium sonneborni]|uniref:Transmembrane protein n=1 Tax=Paramecium sonneborni TaxID=65129 RepID=A0A8S1NCB1_9CILI|nr:unnamed protein product [Paramecium sonneborni]